MSANLESVILLVLKNLLFLNLGLLVSAKSVYFIWCLLSPCFSWLALLMHSYYATVSCYYLFPFAIFLIPVRIFVFVFSQPVSLQYSNFTARQIFYFAIVVFWKSIYVLEVIFLIYHHLSAFNPKSFWSIKKRDKQSSPAVRDFLHYGLAVPVSCVFSTSLELTTGSRTFYVVDVSPSSSIVVLPSNDMSKELHSSLVTNGRELILDIRLFQHG